MIDINLLRRDPEAVRENIRSLSKRLNKLCKG